LSVSRTENERNELFVLTEGKRLYGIAGSSQPSAGNRVAMGTF